MLRREKFTYNGKVRDVLVTEENDASIKGIDLGYADDSKREEILKVAGEINSDKWSEDEELAKSDVTKLRECGALSCFRHFKKSSVVRE